MGAGCLDTPLGSLTIESDEGFIRRLRWDDSGRDGHATPEIGAGLAQLRAYFDGTLTDFDLPLYPEGSEFQRAVCAQMQAIPFGETRTYGELSKVLDAPAQAIGNACGGNSIPVIIPCHRVLGASGLGGFSGQGGVETKVWLLKHEGAAGLLI